MYKAIKTPPYFYGMEGKTESVPTLSLAGSSSVKVSSLSIKTNKPRADEENDDDEETAFTLEEDILKLLGIIYPTRQKFDPEAPLLDISGIYIIIYIYNIYLYIYIYNI